LGWFSSLDHSVVDGLVDNLVDRIQGNVQRNIPSLAKRMTQAFIALYQSVVQQDQNQLNAVPPPPPAQVAQLQAEISQLQNKINTLNQFLQTLKP
jgi:TolA-binding protein